ncbi:MAG: serine/threonine-protein kinase [Planctomycetota bacterium]
MVTELTPLEILREACLRSGLVTSRQWKRVAREALEAAERDQSTSPDGGSVREHESTTAKSSGELARDRMSDALVDHGLVTPYQAQQLKDGRTKLSLGNYRITDWLGQGGMGQVFAGVHEVMGRRCAIKVLPLEKATDETRDSFMREIRLQAALDCPYLVRAFDAGKDGSVHYLVTELIDGTDLRQLVKRHGPLTMQQAASIMAQAAAGLAYAHETGLIHRDIKPANILVTHDGHAKVSDVGLAALTKPSLGMADDEADPRAGKIVGTADYLSPEQIRTPDQIGPASDIYSLGCTLYFAVTGEVPFPGGDTREKCRRHLMEAPWHPKKYSRDISDAFADTIADMMEKRVEMRIASAADVVSRLSPWAAAETTAGDSDWLADLGIDLTDHPTADRGADNDFWQAESSAARRPDRPNDIVGDRTSLANGGSSTELVPPPPPGSQPSEMDSLTLPTVPAPPPAPPAFVGASDRERSQVKIMLLLMTSSVIAGLAGWWLARWTA